MEKSAKIFVAGHNGMVGSAILRKLKTEGYSNFVLRSSKELDLRNQEATNHFFETERPEYVFLAAAKVGGINANNVYRADFIFENLMIETNVMYAAFKSGVKKLLFLGSSCIYPKFSQQPIKEDYLLTGGLEATNEPYAIAKIAGIKMCDALRSQYGCDFISAMPTNLYGPNDHYDLNNSHVLPAMLRKFIIAKRNNDPSVEIWGTGTPHREFLHADDMADACLHLMQNYSEPGPINVGTGEDISIKELAILIKKITGFEGDLIFNTNKPDGTPRKLLDVTRLNDAGWRYKILLDDGIRDVYEQIKDYTWD